MYSWSFNETLKNGSIYYDPVKQSNEVGLDNQRQLDTSVRAWVMRQTGVTIQLHKLGQLVNYNSVIAGNFVKLKSF